MSKHAHLNLMEVKNSLEGRVEGLEGRFGRGPMGARDIGVSHWRYAPASGRRAAIATASRRRPTSWSPAPGRCCSTAR